MPFCTMPARHPRGPLDSSAISCESPQPQTPPHGLFALAPQPSTPETDRLYKIAFITTVAPLAFLFSRNDIVLPPPSDNSAQPKASIAPPGHPRPLEMR
ncbi:hypothetical protein AAFF_G00187280 [Aldrovandia affinis]|uniref:Uncharacterized protein n=1 Tax=Aldrovandia affinis TaxID=143900 RepID=A0AAD7WV84_9TELE|nr:hypothetical protein AAFF_G00187280 [Aldrovandia affinis]